MAKVKRTVVSNEPALSSSEKIARLLALVVTKDMDTDDAAVKLDAVGFDAGAISRLLGVNSNYVAVAKYRLKGRGAKAKKPKKHG